MDAGSRRRLSRRIGPLVALVTLTTLAVPSLADAQTSAAGPAPPDSEFEKVTLNDSPGEPMDLAVLPDGRVLHATRAGQLRLNDPATGLNTVAAELDVYSHDEEGLQNVALDPNFEQNKWVYLYYSPRQSTPVDDPVTPVNEGDAPEWGTPADFEPYQGVIRLSRFKWKQDTLDLKSEQTIIDVPVDRGICCHVGGDIVFDSAGNLILSTGDDTNPFRSDGYTPIDERPFRNPAFDAQRTSGNTNDLRGKLLRITPGKQGGYTIPEGNLFPAGMPGTRPEIYVMGLRNPFRIEIDRTTDELYVADYSPDNRVDDPTRGPAGRGKWAVVGEPANYGWPYCSTAELPYVDFDFATGESGETFDCSAPVNESPHNTGIRSLPRVTQPEVWYGFGPSAEFPELGQGGIGPMGGPAYDFDPATASPTAWPEYFDGLPLFYEWTRDVIKAFRLDEAGRVTAIEPVLDTVGAVNGDDATLDNGMDLEFGPDGALYALEYGDGFFSENPDAQLARIDYIGPDGNHAPRVQVSADRVAGLATPFPVEFSSAGTSDPDGDDLAYAWDLDADGKVDATEPNPSFTYKKEGVFQATLKVTDEHGRSAASSVEIIVGNQPPTVRLLSPQRGQDFSFGDAVDFQVAVTDEEAIDCNQVQVHYIVGHNTHGHSITTAAGCEGTIQTSVPEGHDPAFDTITGVFVAEYTDPGELVGSTQVVLQPSE